MTEDLQPSALLKQMKLVNQWAKTKLPVKLLRIMHLNKLPKEMHQQLYATCYNCNDDGYCSTTNRIHQHLHMRHYGLLQFQTTKQ